MHTYIVVLHCKTCMVITVVVDMRHLVIILITVALMDSSDSQYPANCVSCTDGEYIILHVYSATLEIPNFAKFNFGDMSIA